MDTTILNLLFNYKGAITSREFRIGIVIVLLSIGVYFGAYIDLSLLNSMAGGEGAWWLSTVVLYNQVANFYAPTLVPTMFIISYSSFILAVKRIRMLTNNRTIVIASGILNYLFFASSMALTMQVAQVGTESNMQQNGYSFLSFFPSVFFFIGGVNLIWLCLRKPSESIVSSHPKGQLNVSDYSIKLGKLICAAVAGSVVIGIAFSCLGKILLLSPIVPIVFGGLTVVLIFFYIKYSVYRLKDANVSVLWLVYMIVVYIIMYCFKIWLNMNSFNFLTLYYNTIFAIVSNLFILAQFSLLLLPTRKNEELPLC